MFDGLGPPGQELGGPGPVNSGQKETSCSKPPGFYGPAGSTPSLAMTPRMRRPPLLWNPCKWIFSSLCFRHVSLPLGMDPVTATVGRTNPRFPLCAWGVVSPGAKKWPGLAKSSGRPWKAPLEGRGSGEGGVHAATGGSRLPETPSTPTGEIGAQAWEDARSCGQQPVLWSQPTQACPHALPGSQCTCPGPQLALSPRPPRPPC